jgi:hypothetical protein
LQKLEREFSHLLTNYWTNPLRCYIWLHRAISIILESYCDLCLAVITKVLCLHSLSHSFFGGPLLHTAWKPIDYKRRLQLSGFHNHEDDHSVFRHVRQFCCIKPGDLFFKHVLNSCSLAKFWKNLNCLSFTGSIYIVEIPI